MEKRVPLQIETSKEGIFSIQVSDFDRHLCWIINELLPNWTMLRVGNTSVAHNARLLVTARGMPDFVVAPESGGVESWKRIEYPNALSDRKPRPKTLSQGDMVEIHYVRITDFRAHRPALLSTFLPRAGVFHVTRRGWPVFRVIQPSKFDVDMNQRIDYDPVAEWPDPEEDSDD